MVGEGARRTVEIQPCAVDIWGRRARVDGLVVRGGFEVCYFVADGVLGGRCVR
jgi:hypothetical protein